MVCEPPRPRMRLPFGFCRLRPDLGAVIRSYRRGEAGKGERIAPKVFAAQIGIGRVALSRIEKGKAWPRPETLERMLAAFELDWPQVAEAGPNPGPYPRTPDTAQDGQQADLCDTLRWGRRRLGWTLAELARHSGVSASQLSRIERGQAARSAVFTWHPEDDGIVREDRRIIFANPLLADVAAGRVRLGE
jgi:transcriptional regulator with XRE-family HTH domain